MQRLDPKTTALLVIDIQERLVPAMEPAAVARLVKATDLLLEAARLLGVATLATEQYPKGLGATIDSLMGPLEQLRCERVSKTCFSAMETPEVGRFLAKLSPRAVIVVGMETHVCVFQTVRELAARGYEVHVPHDGVASRRDEDRRVGLELMQRAGGIVTTSETVVFDWLQRAEGDAFKALSKRMR
ncbi:MAG: isochorismatase family protein [Deltaproteobacteria bacterium]|nr:isochorismatase family protein [Deltaproteobacteria bacterium]